jgi:hypothetical protein
VNRDELPPNNDHVENQQRNNDRQQHRSASYSRRLQFAANRYLTALFWLRRARLSVAG